MASPQPRAASEPAGLAPAQLHLLATLCSDLADAPGLPTLVARLATGLSGLLHFDQAALAMKAPDGRLWGLVRPRLAEGPEPSWIELADPGSPLEEALARDEPVQRHARNTHQLPAGMEASTPIRELSLFPFALSLPIRGPQGPLGALGIFAANKGPYAIADLHVLATLAPIVEVTARKLVLMEEAARGDRDRQRLERLRREIVEQLTSELRSPLTVLYNGLDFLQSALLPPAAAEAREQVDEMRLVAGTTVDMVENLVEQAQIDDGTLELSAEKVGLLNLLRERAQLRSAAARIGEVQVLVRSDPADASISIDSQLLSRVVDTLLVNSLRHTARRGQVALVAVARPHLVTIAVADSGTAIPPGDRDILLERGPFDGKERPSSRSFGLGFARTAVEYLGGKLSIEAAAGAPNIFRIALPQ
jgi:signal transduction histidine kinase